MIHEAWFDTGEGLLFNLEYLLHDSHMSKHLSEDDKSALRLCPIGETVLLEHNCEIVSVHRVE